ncbi:RodZ domain-containing protein [Enterococcus faecalis]
MASVNIGETLKEARLQKNISIDELQQMTKIQKRYLEIIEQNDFESLPGTFYVRAFIRQYASAVGLDGNQLVDIYDGKEPAIVEEPKPVYEELEGSRKQLHDEEKQSSWLLRNLPAIAFSLIGLAIAVVVLYIMWQDQKAEPIIQTPATSASVEKPKESSQTPESSTQSSTPPSSSSEPEKKTAVAVVSDANNQVTATVKDANSPINITFKGTEGSCWIGVMVDGNYTYQHTLQAGETQTTALPANAANATLILGASNNVAIQVDGADLTLEKTPVLIRKDVTLGITYR